MNGTVEATPAQFIHALYPDSNGLLELRALDRKGAPAGRTFIPPRDQHALNTFFASHLQDHLYFGVATRRNHTSGTLDNCAVLPALFCDIDFKHSNEENAITRVREFPLAPTAIIRSGGGLHTYWQLREPLDLQNPMELATARSLLRRLAVACGGDLHAAEPARCLRLPGSVNVKPEYEPPRQVQIQSFNPDHNYDPSDFDSLLPAEPIQPVNGTFVTPKRIHDGARNETLWRSGRSLRTKGFCRAAIAAALRAENVEKCEPPIDAEEMEKVIQSAWTQADRPDFLRQESPPLLVHEKLDPQPADTSHEVPFTVLTPPESFITCYMNYATHRTDAPMAAHEALAFTVLSALASHVRLPIATATRGWNLVLWVLYLVNSTSGRKSTTLDLAVDIIRSILGDAAILSWEGSAQGFIQRLQMRDGAPTIFVRDEYSGLLAGMNRGGHLATLPQVLIKAYDGSVLENIRTRKRNADGVVQSDTDRVESPYLVQLGAAPWDAFCERATTDNVLDGFLARFVVVTGSASGRPLPPLTEHIRLEREAILSQARQFFERANAIEQVAFAPGVLEAQWNFELLLLERATASACPEAAGPSLKRLAEAALKCAALLAIEETAGTVLTIRLDHFTSAAAITDRWCHSSLRLVDALGRTTFRKDCDAVLTTIRHHPNGLPMSKLYRAHRHLRKRDFDEILAALSMQEEIVVERATSNGSGRIPDIVRPLRSH